MRRGEHPDKGKWALPGGFVRLGDGGFGEGGGARATRLIGELAEETGVEVFNGYLEQLKTYGSPWRDRRGRVFTTAYVGMMPDLPVPQGGSDAADTHFFAMATSRSVDGPELAFDHAQIIEDALERVRGKIEYEGRLAASFLSSPSPSPNFEGSTRPYGAGPSIVVTSAARFFLLLTSSSRPGTSTPRPAGRQRTCSGLGHATQFHPPMLARLDAPGQASRRWLGRSWTGIDSVRTRTHDQPVGRWRC